MSKIDQLKSMLRTKKGMAFGLQELVATLVVVGILLMIGVWVFATVSSSIDQDDLTAEQNDTIDNIRDTTLDAMDLAVVALIVLAAAVIIGILVKAFS